MKFVSFSKQNWRFPSAPTSYVDVSQCAYYVTLHLRIYVHNTRLSYYKSKHMQMLLQILGAKWLEGCSGTFEAPANISGMNTTRHKLRHNCVTTAVCALVFALVTRLVIPPVLKFTLL